MNEPETKILGHGNDGVSRSLPPPDPLPPTPTLAEIEAVDPNGEHKSDLILLLPERQQKFLDAFRKRGTIIGACEATGVSYSLHYHWMKERKENELYRAVFLMQHELVTQRLEQEAIDRSLAGVADPASASMLQFKLKARRPTIYRDTQQVNIQNNMNFTGDIEQARARAISMRDAYALPATPSVNAPDGTQAGVSDAGGVVAPVREGGA